MHEFPGYHLNRELGRGAMAVVYLATQLSLKRPVALKVLDRSVDGYADMAQRFIHEAHTLAGLRHRNIVTVHDVVESGQGDFITMEYLDGGSLGDRLPVGLSVQQSLAILAQLGSALDTAHARGVVHRDIKPDNVLFRDADTPVLTDFGIAREIASDAQRMTQAGMVLGTPSYMAPEQISGDPVDGRADQYSLGAMWFQMLTGRVPYEADTTTNLLYAHMARPIPRLPEALSALQPVLDRMLAKTADERYPDMAAMLLDVSRHLLRAPGLLRSPPGAPQMSPTERLHQLGFPTTGMHAVLPAGATQVVPSATPDGAKKKAAASAIAVLPLENMSADPENEYFSDGMTEEIINALSKVPGIHVASRSSSFAFKGRKDVNAREIGEKLGVTTLLEGSVRKVGSRIRIAAQLVNVENGYQLWSETYDRQLEDIFAVQDEISRSIVDALKLRLAGDEAAVVAPTKNLDAYTTYLKGRFHFNKFTEVGLRKAYDLFQSALLQDPGFARAYAGIADVWCDLADDWVAPDEAYPQAKAAAERALQRDPELADAMISIGKVLCWHEWKFAEGVRYVERAVILSPNNAEAHWVLGTALPLVGRLREGYESVRRALELDPLRVEYFGWATRLLLYAKDYEAALKQGEETFEIDENYGRGFIFVGSTHLAMGDAETALEWFQRGQRLETAVRSYDAMIVRALSALGRREEAEEILARLEMESRQHYVRAEYLAMGHAAVGHLDEAFAALERAYQARSAGLIYLHLDPGYEPLRSDPRYAEMVLRIGLR